MGVLLKQVLQRLCSGNHWAYAIFWNIGCQNPNLLIWEESYYEPQVSSRHTSIPGTENGHVPFGEWEGCWISSNVSSSSVGIEQDGRASTLLDRMMMNKPFNIVGEGIVGRAAVTGNHQWILSSTYSKYPHPPEVLTELHNQFSAGMQTVAVIPVLPHGVVQLGSCLAIMENIGFICGVKRLILQLGCVPGALLCENYLAKNTFENGGVPTGIGMPTNMHPYRNYKGTSSTQMNHQNPSSHVLGLVGQPSHSHCKGTQTNSEANASAFQTPNLTQSLPKDHDNLLQPFISPLMKPSYHNGGQLRDRVGVAEVITSNSDAWLNQLAPDNPRCELLKYSNGYSQSATILGSLEYMEHQISSVGTITHNFDSVESVPIGYMTQLGKNGSLILGQRKNSVITPSLVGESQAYGGSTNHSRLTAVPYSPDEPVGVASIIHSGICQSGVKFRKPYPFQTGVSSSSLADQSASVDMVSNGSDQRQIFAKGEDFTRPKLPPLEQGKDDKMFQSLNIPLTHQHECMPSEGIHDDFAGKSCTPGSANATDDVCARISSGDDLFDVLGVDFKNKFLNGDCNSFLADTRSSHKIDLATNNPTFRNEESGTDYYSLSEGRLNSSIVMGVSADHLLDAVVSRPQPKAIQSADDNVSCKTTLTKINSSSVPCSSPGGASMSNHAVASDLSKDLGKVGLAEISSFVSGCSTNNAGNCSQTTSNYGSQISSWVEQGINGKHESSVSTAYSKKPDVMEKSNRKRLKPGENPRPRPKDRQMIQDRVKELREIVPNGAKCSIDALLERTIKHMLFLQSVTKHADKLKQTEKARIIGKEWGPHLKDNFDGKATWAFEVGSQSINCPIIVEELDPPRQMLVEMLCEEQGFFLEIANLIRGLGLTILKGVMEIRNDKSWAHFAVEANQDVTRMEIFMSLVHLLEQTGKGTTVSVTAIKNNNIVHHSYAQAAPIAATGLL